MKRKLFIKRDIWRDMAVLDNAMNDEKREKTGTSTCCMLDSY